MKKIIPLLLALIVMILYGCSGGSSSQESASQEASTQESSQELTEEETEEVSLLVPMARATADDLPPVVLEGEGYQLEIPADEEGIECTPVSDERVEELRQQGYEFISRPIHVSLNGDNHVELMSAATVRIAIPEDYPEEWYDELVGVLITDNGPEYKIPDYDALREGYVQFRTCHFTDAAIQRKKDELREQFIEKVAVNGWGRNMNNKQVEPKLRDQIDKFAFDFCLGKDDLIGIAMREVFGDNDIVKIGLDIVNAYDMEVATFEQRAEVASQTMLRVTESKLLAYFLNALKEEDDKKDDEKDESKRNKIIGVLEEHFGIDNVETMSTMAGKKASAEEWFIYACQYIGNYALDKWKSAVEEMVPYIGYMKQMATAVEIWKKFWAATEMQMLYDEYKNLADEQGGIMSPDDWTTVSRRVKAPEFLHGMKDEKIKEMIEKRYHEQKEIEKRKVELRKYLAIIESTVNMNHPVFLLKNFDYVQRLTIVNNLITRFRDELVDHNGYLYFNEYGKSKQYIHPNAITKQLCLVVNQYLNFYPDRAAFNAWLSENGYNTNSLQKEFKRLDALLWKEKPNKNPDIHIVIQESLGAAGRAQYAGYVIYLGRDGVPYEGWDYYVSNTDKVRDEGWSAEFPAEDEYMKLSKYKAIGRPNQVLVYDNGYTSSEAVPVKTIPFEVDTTNSYTYVELNPDNDKIVEFAFCNDCHSYGVHIEQDLYQRTPFISPIGMGDALEDALKDVHLYLSSRSDHFSFSTSGEYFDGNMSSHIDLKVSGDVDFEKKKGTCAITAILSGENKQRAFKLKKARFDLTGSIVFYPIRYGNYAIGIAGTDGLIKWSAVDRGNSGSYETIGHICFDFQAVDEE